jgi:HK97 gp10 family phage protein
MIQMKFEGGQELASALAKLGVKMSTKVLLGALVEGAEPIRKAMSAHAPRGDEPPHVADHIVVSKARTEDMAAVAIGPARGFAYALPLEVGTIDTKAQPFARPAYDENEARALKITGDALWRELAGEGISRSSLASTVVEAPGGGDLL